VPARRSAIDIERTPGTSSTLAETARGSASYRVLIGVFIGGRDVRRRGVVRLTRAEIEMIMQKIAKRNSKRRDSSDVIAMRDDAAVGENSLAPPAALHMHESRPIFMTRF